MMGDVAIKSALTIPYSRSLEEEADRIGIQLAAKVYTKPIAYESYY